VRYDFFANKTQNDPQSTLRTADQGCVVYLPDVYLTAAAPGRVQCWSNFFYGHAAIRTCRHLFVFLKTYRYLFVFLKTSRWIKAFFEQHFHCTRYAGECSTVTSVKASVIQGSALGPASFILTATDLHPTTPGNRIFKFADDTYLVVPAANSSSRLDEVSHVEDWASRNIISG